MEIFRMDLWEKLFLPECWQEFMEYKIEKQHISGAEQAALEDFIKNRTYLSVLAGIGQDNSSLPLPHRKEVNKSGVSKKRVVYSFSGDFNMVLKMTAYLLFRYDDLFSNNCYAFRRSYGVKDAVRRIRCNSKIADKYCLKIDISNYFNSIDVPLLLQKLEFLKARDERLFHFLKRLLTEDKAIIQESGQEVVIEEKRGAMAGIPIAPFLANVYLMDVDRLFAEKQVLYFRYSDDILIFADSMEELEALKQELYNKIEEHFLTLNPAKVHISAPGEAFEFLGFRFADGEVDLSDSTVQKIKAKIKRKAHALRRWQQKKNLPGERAAKGFIRSMNRKFYDDGSGTEFSWSRWFFPCITTDTRLREVDAYMQQYIRYCVTGRHYKGNYRITYEQMKQWGYRSLVHEYYLPHESQHSNFRF